MKIKWKVTIYLALMFLSIILLTNVLVRKHVTGLINDQISEELQNYSSIGVALINSTYPGDWKLVQDQLFKGGRLINNNNTVVDELTAGTNFEATIFAMDTRISTTVSDENGDRIIGSKASTEVINNVISKAKPYQGKATVAGRQASTFYIPILDKDGSVVGMWFVGVYTDTISEKINESVIAVAQVLIAIGVVGIFLSYLLGQYLGRGYIYVSKELGRMEQGDFNFEVSEKALKRRDEIGEITLSLKNMQTQIRTTIQTIKHGTDKIVKSSTILANAANNVYTDIENISATTEELSAGMEETSASTQEISATSVSIEDEINHVVKNTNDGQVIASEIKVRAGEIKNTALESQRTAVDIYEDVNKQLRSSIEKASAINEIKKLSKTILEVTKQTNLLSLNASIEAARAGKTGQGFGVIATEIKKLAENSQEAVSQIDQITSIISSAMDDIVNNSLVLLNFVDTKVIGDYDILVNTGEQYDKDAKTIEAMVGDINNSSQILNEAVGYIRRAIEEVTVASQEGATGSTDIAEKSTSIFHKTTEVLEQANINKETANKLYQEIQFFKV